MKLQDKKLFLLDMDGTIYNEDTLFPGVLDFLNTIKKKGGRYIFITNNSSKGIDEYVKKVNNMGIDAKKDDFFSSTKATSIILKEKFSDKLIYVQGTDSMIKELVNDGLNVTKDIKDDIACILLGFDTELTSEKLRNTSYLLTKRDLPYYATNPDLRCPVNFGYIPDCGSIAMMLYNATGKKPIYIGKPEPTMINYAIEKFGYTKEETVVIGDRIYTDIKSGVNANVDTVCVLSGEVTLEDINNSDIKPTYILKTVSDIFK